MNELLEKLKAADAICKQANPYYESATQLQQQCDEQLATLPKRKKKWIIIAVVIYLVIVPIVSNILLAIPVIGKFLGAVAGMGGLVAAIFVGVNGWKKEQVKTDEEVARLQKEIQAKKDQGQAVFDQYAAEMDFLPVDYWYPLATEYLVNMVKSGRASTLGEAIDRFDEQLHRWKIEESNAQMLAMQQQQTAHLASIKTSSKISAAANVTNTIFNIAKHL